MLLGIDLNHIGFYLKENTLLCLYNGIYCTVDC